MMTARPTVLRPMHWLHLWKAVIVCKAVIQSEVKYNEQILSTVNNYWNKLLKASDFEATWTQYVNALKRNGIEEIVKERTAYYNKYIKNK